ncbi:MAG: potassium-transporting ATPase subunit KdpA [Bacillota bacterium]|nr:potassium-transporting ATPase subunit KdpA [Bacillota bacterium]
MIYTILTIIIALFIIVIVAKPFGHYLAIVFDYETVSFKKTIYPVERIIYRLSGIKQNTQTWKQYALAFILTNGFMMILIYLIFRLQDILPFNPNNLKALEPTLAYHTAVSFITNTNQQHYSGENNLSYFSQMAGVIFAMFAAPASALSISFAFMRGLSGKAFGNFFVDFVRAITRVLLPIAFIMGFVFVFLGAPETLGPSVIAHTIEGAKQEIARGPIGAFLSIKELGNNGGGFFGANSAHPFENPNGISNFIQIILMFLLPTSLPFTYGKIIGKKKQGKTLFIAMLMMFLIILGITLVSEYQGNPDINSLLSQNTHGSMEGKEVRIGIGQSAFYSVVTSATETGAVNNMHDTLTPIGGMMVLCNLLLNTVFGGVGAGFINIMMYAIIAVFLSGLMVGRTPEFLGKKIEGKEMKLIAVTLLMQPFLILVFSAIALWFPMGYHSISNEGYHGISQIIYEYTSAAANNGSGFEGLKDQTPFWNITTSIVMYLGRYFSLITMLAVAGSLSTKKLVPESSGTFQTDTAIFGMILLGTIFIVGALTFFPTLVLGPVAEYLTL